MKIIKQGDMALDWTKQVKCRLCKAELEVVEADVRWAYKYEGGGHPMHDYALSEIRCDCPLCGSKIVVCNPGELSPLMQERLRKRQTTS